MAVVMMDGFDHYNGVGANTGLQAKWTLSGTTSFAAMVAGRLGGQAVDIQIVDVLTGPSRAFPASYGSFSVGFAYKQTVFVAAATVHTVCGFLDGTNTQCGFLITQLGAIAVYRYSSVSAGTLLDTSANGVILLNTWHYIECEVTISDAAGVFNVYVDGVAVLSLSSKDTRNAAAATCDTIRFGSTQNLGTAPRFYIDDLYVVDAATKLGERRVETLYPTSDVAQGFARSTGSVNYSLVDEATVNGDTDYVQGSAVSDVDTYGFQNLSSTPSAIDAIQVSCFAEKTDATARSIALQIKSGATTSDGSNYSLTTSYTKSERILTTDPNTAAAWTASNVDAVQGGPKVTV